MLTEEIIKYIVGPTAVAIITAIPIFYKLYNDHQLRLAEEERLKQEKERIEKELKERELLENHVIDVSKVYEVLQESLLKIPTINRIIIVRAIPSSVNPEFLTIIYEVIAHGVPPIRDVVQNMPIDSFHRDYVVLPLIRDGKVMVDRDTSDGFLKDIYEAYGHSFSKAFKITADEDSMTYIVFSFSEGTLDTTPPLYREAMRGQLNKLVNIFQKPEGD